MHEWSTGPARPFPSASARTSGGSFPPLAAWWVGPAAGGLAPDRPPLPSADTPPHPPGGCRLSPARRRAFLGALDLQLAKLDALQAEVRQLRAWCEAKLAAVGEGTGDQEGDPIRTGGAEPAATETPPADG